MSPQEERNTEAEKKPSMLFGLWKKVTSKGKAGKNAQEAEAGAAGAAEAPVIPEGAAPEEETLPEPTFDQLAAPEEVIEYFQQYCLENGIKDTRFIVRDFCGDPLPEEGLLKQIFSQLDSKSIAAMKDFHRQLRIVNLREEQRQQRQTRGGGEETSPQPEEGNAAPSVNGQVLVFAAPDWTAAWGLALPALGKGEKLTQQSVLFVLGERKISHGVDSAAIDRMISPEGAFILTKLASCTPPVPGEDGRAVEHFPRTVGTPQILENAQGIVDFDNLNWLTHIEAGTVICEIVEPTQGKPGIDIQGKTIRPYNGKKAVLPKGDGVILNQEGTALVSKVDGQISFRDGRFHINDVIVVQGNVDNSTGSLNVHGDLVIHGNVQAGFTIQATGNITIGGLVEGSQVTAGGSIVVNRGMNGNVVGSLNAGKDIVCKYMENASVHADGDVRMDSIVNCDVSARGKVVAKTGRGTIIGGTIRSMGGIEAKTIGNIAGRLTTLIIGPTPRFQQEMARLEAEIEGVAAQEAKLGPALVQMKQKPLKAALAQMEQAEEAALKKQIVAGKLLPIAQVTIGGVLKNVTDTFSPCRIYLDQKEGVIKVINV